jgi:hypothetical protein
MINELHELHLAIERAGIVPQEWHRLFKELRKVSAKTPCFKLTLDNDSRIRDIEAVIESEFTATLRKYEPDNGSAFPVFNLPCMYLFTGDQKKRIENWVSDKEKFRFEELNSWCTNGANNWDSKVYDKLEKCLHKVPKQIQEKIGVKYYSQKNTINELINRLQKICIDDFEKALRKYILENLKKGNNVKTILRFLCPEKQNDIQVVLDLYDWQKFEYPVAHEETIKWLNSALIVAENKISANIVLGKVDAFGDVYSEINEVMPEVKLPGKLGGVKLRAMYHEHGCQYRYKMIDDSSYPISKENRIRIKGALEWLREPEREGFTWGMADSEEILFAYPSVIPASPVKFASVFGAASQDTEGRFESIAEDVIKTLKGLPADKKIKNVEVFAIRKMDKARSKIVYYRNYSAEWLISCAEKWKAGCGNIPEIQFRVWLKKENAEKKSTPEKVGTEIPMPLNIARIINKVWKMDGGFSGILKKIKYYQGLELMLEEKYNTSAEYLLNTLLTNSKGLVLYLGNLLHGGNIIGEKFNRDYLFLTPLLGLLLYKNKRLKEDYMESLPYLIGQMLKISDELHAMYCKVVRDGSIPPQLAGNSMFMSALDTPAAAFSQLGQRINPYIAWAKQYRTKNAENSGLAGWYLWLYEQIATKLKNSLESLKTARFTDAEKAELFIGYLAELPKKEKPSQTENL